MSVTIAWSGSRSGSAGSAAVAVHAERRRVDQQVGVGKQLRQRVEAMRGDAAAETMLQFARRARRVRLTMRMSPKPRCFSAWMTARAAPPAPSTTARSAVSPARRALVEIGGKAVGVGVAAAEHAVLEPQRVDRADQLGRLVARGDRGEGRLLVRDGDVAAGKARSAAGRPGSRRSRPARRRSLDSCRRCRISVSQ